MRVLRTVVAGVMGAATVAAGLSMSPAPAQADTSVYIVAVGDIACDPSPKGTTGYAPAFNDGDGTPIGCRQKAVAESVIAAKPDQFWALGDNQYYDGTYAKYMAVYDKAFGSLKPMTKPIPGNHEWLDTTIPKQPGLGYYTYFGDVASPQTDGTYSFNVGDWHVLAINSMRCNSAISCGPGSPMAEWIAADMAANPRPCTVAMWHHPLWSLSTEFLNGGYAEMVPVWNQLHDLGVDMVLTGHDHTYMRTKPLGKAIVDPANSKWVLPPTYDPKGMVQFVIGTGGENNHAPSPATIQKLAPVLAANPTRMPSPGLFGAGGFRLSSDRYTFSYLPAADSFPFADAGGRTCRRATNGNPEEFGVDIPKLTPITQEVTWAPTNTTVKATSASGGTITPSPKAKSNGDGAITYDVADAGMSGCRVNQGSGVITYTDPGVCEVTATAAATATYKEGIQVAVFTITAAAQAQQKVTWAPTPTTIKATSTTGGTFTPSSTAVSSGDGEITYAVTSSGATGCRVDPDTAEITYTSAGSCQVTATAAATAKFSEARRVVAFTITAAPAAKKQVITAVQPATGPLAGGNTIMLIGQGFTGATKVVMGDAEAKFTVISDTKMSVAAPAGRQEGPVDIRVTVGAPLGAIVAPGGYTYSSTDATAPTDDSQATEPTMLGNPEQARTIASGLRLLSRSEASRLTTTTLRRPAGPSPSTAPSVRVKAGVPFALVVRGLTDGDIVSISATVRGRTVAVGSAGVGDDGTLLVPALQASRTGVLTLALTTDSGDSSYVRVRVTR